MGVPESIKYHSTCYIVGQGSMVVNCGEMLLTAGVSVLGVITEDHEARDWAISRKIPHRPYTSAVTEDLVGIQFDYLFSIVNFHILPEALIRLPKLMCINYHDGPLPRYAGRFTPSWALLEGTQEYAINWHVVEPRVDAGDLLISEPVMIETGDTSLTLNAKCYFAGIDAFGKLIEQLISGSFTRTPQNNIGRSYYALNRRPAGCGLLDLDLNAKDLERVCRAFDFGPYERPWGFPKLVVNDALGQRHALIVNSMPRVVKRAGSPGRILEINEQHIIVATGQDSLVFEGFADSLNGNISIQMVRQRYELTAGTQLPLLDADLFDRVNDFQSSLFIHESFWAKQLEWSPFATTCPSFVDVSLEKTTVVCAVPSTENSRQAFRLQVILAFSRFAISHFQGQALGYESNISRKQPSDIPSVFAPVLPLYTGDLPETDQDALSLLNQRLVELEKHLRYRFDLALSASAHAPVRATNFPVCFKMGQDDEPSPGASFCLLLNLKENRLTICYHPELAEWVNPLQEVLGRLEDVDGSHRDTTVIDGSVLSLVHGPERSYPQGTLYPLFEQQAHSTPDRVALEYLNNRSSYAELEQRVETLAIALWHQGARPQQKIAVHAERHPDMVITLLAILRIGATYLPLDPAYPSQRLAFMVEDANISLLVGHGKRPDWLTADIDVFDLYQDLTGTAQALSDFPVTCPATTDDLAYVIYTSGSTGKPKGVQIQHGAVVNFLCAMADQPGLNKEDILVAITSISFDIATLEIFLPLLNGARVVLADRVTAGDGQALAELLTHSRATIMQATPATWGMLISAGWKGDRRLKKLCGGETLSRDLAAQLVAMDGELWNMYGPTEATVWCSHHRVQDTVSAVPVGYPIANTSIYILDEMMDLVPVGHIGELYIGGNGLSHGYLNQPELTAERFVELDLDGHSFVRLYRTGDLAAVTPQGWLVFHGRMDQQVKLRGYRIELEEIEAVLEHNPAVEQAVVSVNKRDADDGTEITHLVAYLHLSAVSPQPERHVLRQYVASELPEYMIPDIFVSIDEFPLTPNGKIDRTALPMPTRDNMLSDGISLEPVTSTEQYLAQHWSRLLGLESVGLDESFFEIGGNSLLAGQFIQSLGDKLDEKINPVLLFANPTVRRMAVALTKRFGNNWNSDDMSVVVIPETKISMTPIRDEDNQHSSDSHVEPLVVGPLVVGPLVSHVANDHRNAESLDGGDNDPVAIVGMACRFPGAANLEEFFENLIYGVDSVTDLPADRRLWCRGKQLDYPVNQQGSLDNITRFDYEFFGISRREARRMDPLQRLAVEVAHEVVENAGYSPADLSRQRTGVYLGCIANEYTRLLTDTPLFHDAQTGTGNAASMLANRISYLFDWHGPSMVVDTACSSSLVCLDLAMKAIRAGQVDSVLVGGVNLVLVSDNTVRFASAGMLSNDGRCYTFDDQANGYVRGEGIGAVLIKPLSRAIADGDTIWSVIRGSAVNHDGRNKVGLTAPSPGAQEEVLRQAYQDAGVSPATLGYLEAHGTGTSLGDPIEIHALTEFFRHESKQSAFCAIGSAKSNIGHLEPSAGIAGLIKSALCLNRAVLAPTLHVKQPNRHILFEETPFYIIDRYRVWQKSAHPRRAGVSSFGFGGTNAHVVLEEPPPRPQVALLQRPWHLFTLSAKTEESLDRLVTRYLNFLERGFDHSLEELCANTSLKRQHFNYRLAMVVSQVDQVIDKLRLWQTGQLTVGAQSRLTTGHGNVPENEENERCIDEDTGKWLVTLPEPVQSRLKYCFRHPVLNQHLKTTSQIKTFRGESDWRTFYQAVLQLYIQGFNPHWPTLYDGKIYVNIPLPSYSFERRICWISPIEVHRARHQHPLVKEEKASIQGACFDLDLDPSLWLLDEHQVGDRAVLPGTALLDLALYVTRQQLQAKHIRLHHIHFHRPLTVATGGQQWRLLLRPGEHNEVIVYDNAEQEDAWQKPFFRASVQAVSFEDEHLDIDGLQQFCHDRVVVDHIYEGFEKAGLYYGPRFRCITHVKASENEILGFLEYPDDEDLEYLLHPALTDAAFQTALSPLLSKCAGNLYLPFAIDSVEYFSALTGRLFVHARLHSSPEDSATVRADISLADDHGRVRARLNGVTWRRLNHELSDTTQYRRLMSRLRIPGWSDAGAESTTLPQSGHWLVFGKDEPLSMILRDHLAEANCQPVLVEAGKKFNVQEKNHITISPDRSEHYQRLFHWLKSNDGNVAGVVYLWDLQSVGTDHSMLKDSPASLTGPLYRCLYLLKALSGQYKRKKMVLRVVTAGAAATEGNADHVVPSAGALSAFVRVAALENPQWDIAALDLAIADLDGDVETTKKIARSLFTELGYRENRPVELALRPLCEPSRLQPDLLPLPAEDRLSPTSRLRTGGVYLITGGLGSIGKKLTVWLATHYRAKVALLVRNPVKDYPEPLASLLRVGHQIASFSVDVSDAHAVARVIRDIEVTLGPVNGIFHAAGTLRDGLLTGQTDDQLAAVLQPKVQGLVALDDLVTQKTLDFTLLFSSVSGLEGNIGQASYAAANRFLDVYAQRQQAMGYPVYSINWGLWSDTVMGQAHGETARNRGLAILSSVQGMAIIEDTLRRSNTRVVLVADEQTVTVPNATTSMSNKIIRLNDFRELASVTPPNAKSAPETVKKKLARLDIGHSQVQVISLVKEVLAKLLERSLDEIEVDIPLLEIGLDSVLAVSGVTALEQKTGLKLPPTLLFDYPTATRLAEALEQRYGYNKPENVVEQNTAFVARKTSPAMHVPVADTIASRAGVIKAPHELSKDDEYSGITASSATSEVNKSTGDIAVIGVAGRFPGASNIDEFWQILARGESTITEVPGERWNLKDYFDPGSDEVGKIYAKWGGFIDHPYDFDALFFRLSPRDAEWTDPQQRLLLETTWQTLENAGYASALQGSSTGVFVAASYSHYRDQNVDDNIQTPAGLGNLNAILANRISYFYDFHGPSLTVDTLCSSSLVALNIAVQNLRTGVCEQALVAGVHVDMSPRYYQMACRLRAFSPTGHCHSFDRAADGFVPGEGCASVLLKPLEQAIADGDNIWGVIRGTAVNHGGQGSGLTVPRASSQAQLVRHALADANLEPDAISYIEAHGTGTVLGDPIEVAALTEVFANAHSLKQHCAIGTVKTNIGHLEPAAGMAGLIKVLLCLRSGQLPPGLLTSEVNPAIHFETTPFYLNDRLVNWESADDVRRAGISSFGMGGVNAHVIVEQAPEPVTRVNDDKRSVHLLVLSARSQSALRSQINQYVEYFERGVSEPQWGDVCATLARGRSHFKYRLATVVNTGDQAGNVLKHVASAINETRISLPSSTYVTPEGKKTTPKLAFIFSGQGSQLSRMAETLYETSTVFRECLDHCAELLKPYMKRPLLAVLYDEEVDRALIHETGYAQPVLFSVEYALAKLLLSWNVKPDAVLGHSVGEYVAACVAGVFTLEDGLRLIAERARLMQSLPADQGGMVAIRAGRESVEKLIGNYEGLVLAADNGPLNQTISGSKTVLQQLVADVGDSFRVIPLAVSHAFHSPLLQPVIEPLRACAEKITHYEPRLPMISNLTGEVFEDAPDSNYWVQHMSGTVRFSDGMSTLKKMGIDMLVEIGPQGTLLRLCQQLPEWSETSVMPALERGQDDWQTLLAITGKMYALGVDINWSNVYADPTRRVPLPTYPFERRTYRAQKQIDPPKITTPVTRSNVVSVELAHHPLLDRRLK